MYLTVWEPGSLVPMTDFAFPYTSHCINGEKLHFFSAVWCGKYGVEEQPSL